MPEIMNTTIRVETMEEKEVLKENTERTEYKISGHDSEKLAKVVLTSPLPFNGIKPGELIDIKLISSQKTMFEFQGEPEEEKEGD